MGRVDKFKYLGYTITYKLDTNRNKNKDRVDKIGKHHNA